MQTVIVKRPKALSLAPPWITPYDMEKIREQIREPETTDTDLRYRIVDVVVEGGTLSVVVADQDSEADFMNAIMS